MNAPTIPLGLYFLKLTETEGVLKFAKEETGVKGWPYRYRVGSGIPLCGNFLCVIRNFNNGLVRFFVTLL